MRTVAKPALALIVGVLALSCTDLPTGPALEAPQTGVAAKPGKKADGIVAVPFRARFFTEIAGFVPEDCGPGVGLNIQVGEGNATHLGRLTTTMSFCVDLNPGPDFWTYAFRHGDDGRFVSANGDELWFTVPAGRVVPIAEPGSHAAFFKDRFVFTGGTGRFAGATGEGMTDSFVDAALFRTDHEWVGTLELRRGP